MKHTKKLLLALAILLAPGNMHAGWWDTFTDWLSDNQATATVSALAIGYLCYWGISSYCNIESKPSKNRYKDWFKKPNDFNAGSVRYKCGGATNPWFKVEKNNDFNCLLNKERTIALYNPVQNKNLKKQLINNPNIEFIQKQPTDNIVVYYRTDDDNAPTNAYLLWHHLTTLSGQQENSILVGRLLGYAQDDIEFYNLYIKCMDDQSFRKDNNMIGSEFMQLSIHEWSSKHKQAFNNWAYQNWQPGKLIHDQYIQAQKNAPILEKQLKPFAEFNAQIATVLDTLDINKIKKLQNYTTNFALKHNLGSTFFSKYIYHPLVWLQAWLAFPVNKQKLILKEKNQYSMQDFSTIFDNGWIPALEKTFKNEQIKSELTPHIQYIFKTAITNNFNLNNGRYSPINNLNPKLFVNELKKAIHFAIKQHITQVINDAIQEQLLNEVKPTEE